MTNDVQWYIDNKLSHQIHTSSRRAFRACRRRYNWVYNDMYSPKVPQPPLEFGIAFHKAMETFYEPMTWRSPLDVRRDLALIAFQRQCEAHLKSYMKLNPDPDVEVLNDYKNQIELGLGMLKYYCNNISPVHDKRWTPIRVEVGFEVPIKNPDKPTKHCKRENCTVCEEKAWRGQYLWCACDNCWHRWMRHNDPNGDPSNWHRGYDHWSGLPVTYGGRLDALFQDDSGRYWVIDWKTTSRMLDEDAEASFLQLDDQIMSYVWALSQLGIKVAGFVYVEIKKAIPAPPDRLSRLYKGRSFSTNKQFLTTYAMFKETIQNEDNPAWQMGLYDNHLEWLQKEGPKFTQRHQIHKNQAEIDNAGAAIGYEALDMIGNPRIYPQPGRFSCNWCLFKQPCLGMNMGEDYLYTLSTMFEKKTEHYWEIKEASTE